MLSLLVLDSFTLAGLRAFKRRLPRYKEGRVLHQVAQLTEPELLVDKAQTALETLLDTAGLALGAARHGTPMPPKVQCFEVLATDLKAAMKRYEEEAEKVKPAALAKRSAPVSQARKPVTGLDDKEIVQHTEAGVLVDQVAGVAPCTRLDSLFNRRWNVSCIENKIVL
jgi:hypothetical protein